MAGEINVTRIDEKYRVPLRRATVSISGLKKGERLVVVPFKGGIILESTRGRKFSESLRGFVFKEEEHEATAHLKRVMKSAGA